MIKKILFIFITVFAFSNVNSQTNIVGDMVGCVSAGVSIIHEFEDDTLNTNGKISYRRLNTTDGDSLTAFGTVNGAGLASSSNAGIRWNSGGSQWEYYTGGGVVLSNPATSSVPPAGGWVYVGSCPSGNASLTLIGESGGVLGVDKESLENKISIFPNPSSDFISVSNLKNATNYKITNITGQTVISGLIDQSNNQVDIQNLSKGFYFVEIKGKKTIKLIKK